jgi:hypothetical protein
MENYQEEQYAAENQKVFDNSQPEMVYSSSQDISSWRRLAKR